MEKLIITHGKPYKEASADTITRWVKREISSAGIDIKIFKVIVVGQLHPVKQNS